MRGHDKLIAMRLEGLKPKSVSLCDFPIDTDWAKWGDLPRICVKGDPIVDLDLRFVVGLMVFIDSNSEERAEALLQKCIDNGAAIVASSSFPESDPYCKTPSKRHLFFRHFGNIHDNHHHVRLD